MSRKTIGIVDYGVGNHNSVLRTFQFLGYRCHITNETTILTQADLLVLPGVGAFPVAMQSLHNHGLSNYLIDVAREGKPLIGLCLGMQLLANESLEHGTTMGLGIIPGVVRSLPNENWHIGWNSIELISQDSLFTKSNGESFYFNHSYVFDASNDFSIAFSEINKSKFTVAVRRDNVVGLQFHPEKSQYAGKKLLSHIVESLCCG